MSRVLLLSHIYPPAIDGGSTAIAKFGEYLQKQGHEILVVTSNCSSTDDFVKSSPTIVTHSPGIISLPVIKLPKLFKLFPPFFKGPVFKSLPLKKILDFKPNLIVAGPLPTTIIIYAYFYKLITHSRLLICPCYHPADPDFNNNLLKIILKKADFLWCLTQYEKSLLNHPHTIVKGLGVDSDFIIDPAQIKYPSNPNIVFIANFAAHKRVELLIKAYQLLKEKYPKLSLTLLGQKTLYFPQIQIPSDVNLVLSPSRQQIRTAIDNSTLLCLPSIHESFGIVFIESLARGKPVIGADTPQTSEVLKMLSSITFKTDNIDDLKSTLEELLTNPSKFGKDGYNYVKHHLTWDKIGEYICQNIGL